jgi:hypothetical protein
MRFLARLRFAVLGEALFVGLAIASVASAQSPAAPGAPPSGGESSSALPTEAATSPDGGAAPVAPAPTAPAPAPSAPTSSAPAPGSEAPTAGEKPAPQTDVAEEAPAEDVDGESTKIPPNMGRVHGTIVDAKTGEPLIEAQITVVKTGKKVLTDVEGNYRLHLPPGNYDLRIFSELLPARRINNVKVEKGKPTRIDVALGGGEEKVAVQEVEVVAAPDTATEAVQVVRRQKAAVVSDGVSAQQIARSPDSTASDSIKRVVGATIQDNRYVVIRGLGGRYSSTLLNGVTLPSPDPDTPAAPLDLFPAALLANLTVAKTFSPDSPGNFAGGLLMIETRDFPTKFTLKLRATTGGDTESTFRNAYSYKGGKYDFLGFDDGGRALPDSVPSDRALGSASLTPEQRVAEQKGFPNNWDLRSHRLSPNVGLGATVGDTIDLGRGQKLGYLASVTYGHKWTRRITKIQTLGAPLSNGTRQAPEIELTEEAGIEQPSLGGLLTLGYAPSPGHRINSTTLYAHNTENTASRTTGRTEVSGALVDRLRLRFLERGMIFTQLVGEHSLVPGRLVLGWQGNIAYTFQDEPDTRDLLRGQLPTGERVISTSSGGAERQYSELGDRTGGGGFDLSFLMDGAKLKLGGAVLASSRDVDTRRFHFVVGNSLIASPSSEVFAPDNLGRGVRVEDRTQPKDGYQADRAVWAAYVMADVVRLDPLRIILGERFEVSDLNVNVRSKIDPNSKANTSSSLRDYDLLPSVNAILAVSKDSNLRAGYSRTLARPHFREIAPALYFDYVRSRITSGNPGLEETSIQNADLRWETFLGPTELLAASVFYKHFAKPIERTLTSDNVSYTNAKNARSYGLELESRLSFRRFHPSLEPMSLGANLSLIQSRVTLAADDSTMTAANRQTAQRPMQGQSPYVANVTLGYRIEKTKTQLDLLYNVFGRRIVEVGNGAPDVYEEALHRVDLSVTQSLPASLSLKIAATNLLNQRVVQTQDGTELLAYKIGVGVFGTLEWTFNDGRNN